MFLIIIAVITIIIIIRAILFKPQKQEKIQPRSQTKIFDRGKIVEDMSAILKCRTVSNRDENLTDWGEFKKFEELMRARFPIIHEKCTLNKIGKTGLLYHLPGKSSLQPSVCMAHYDVVPAEEEAWDQPPFGGIVENDVIWGRGAIDTKGTLCALCEALEQLLKEGYEPNNDLYLSFSGDEEINGPSCSEIVEFLAKKGVKPEFVLDEGGAVVNHVFPGVTKECAIIGTGEKGNANIEFTIESDGGHTSVPPVQGAVSQLCRAVCRIEKYPFKAQITKQLREMFDTLGRYASFKYRVVFANMWLFKPFVTRYFAKKGGEMNAMLRTTATVTKLRGSDAYNVVPPIASFGVNIRLLGKDTIRSAVEYLRKVIKNTKIVPEIVNGENPPIYSDTKCPQWQMLQEVIKGTWNNVIVSPYLMMACSDARHFCRITDKVYRFSGMRLTTTERDMIHGHNERISAETLLKTVEFYTNLLERL